LLCLHGLSLSGFVFAQYQEHFAAKGIRAIAPCLLGGISMPDPGKTIDDLADEVIELLDTLGIERFDAIGFSWGTLPELALLARIPHRIRKAGLLGAMVPVSFFGPEDAARLKPDIRLSLRMARHVPALHRWLMWLVCRLPVAALVGQFRDENLSPAEVEALAPGSAFNRQLSRCIAECVRTGSRFFTHGWRMVLNEPRYALDDLALLASSRVDVRLYVGEHDNVHLRSFAETIAAACAGTTADGLKPSGSPARPREAGRTTGLFQLLCARDPCTVWMLPGAGRMACMLYLEEALDHLMSELAPAPFKTAPAPSPQ
jgi:pimeloyl-ACP methyl ester carboxylesterase